MQVAPHYAGKKTCAEAKINGMKWGKLDTAGREYFAAIALRAGPRSLAVVPRWTLEDAFWPTPEIRAMRRPPLIAPTGELPLSTHNCQSSSRALNVRLRAAATVPFSDLSGR